MIAMRRSIAIYAAFAIAPDLVVSASTALAKNTQNPDMRPMRNGLCGATTRLRVFKRRPLMATGTVKFFNAQRGYGFIVQDNGGPDVFVHISAVERAGMHQLNEGQKLSFDVQADPRSGKSAAANLQAV
jgi:CspA family cold shock protein